MARRSTVDWDKIQPDYESGVLSVAEVARKHGIKRPTLIRHAEKHGWRRDLITEVRSRTANTLLEEDARSTQKKPDGKTDESEITDNLPSVMSQDEIIERSSEVQVQVVKNHRKDLTELTGLARDLMQMLKDGHYMVGDKKVPLDARERADTFRALTQGFHKLVTLERQAFGLDDRGRDQQPQKVEINFTF